MYKIKVTLDSLMIDTPIAAWTEGETWNGWAVPYFEAEAAHQLLQLYRQQLGEANAWYDAERDQFCFILDGELVPECYHAEAHTVAGHPTKLYPIGASAWIWDVWEPLN